MSKVKIITANQVKKVWHYKNVYIKNNLMNCRAVHFSQQYIRDDSSPQYTEITILNTRAVATFTEKIKQGQRTEDEIKCRCIEKQHPNQTLYQLAAEWGKQ